MQPIDDRIITVAVRRILTAAWTDITRVHVRTTRGVVYLSGHIERMTASNSDFDQSGLQELNARLHALRGVRDVKYRFDNWHRSLNGDWSIRQNNTPPPPDDNPV